MLWFGTTLAVRVLPYHDGFELVENQLEGDNSM